MGIGRIIDKVTKPDNLLLIQYLAGDSAAFKFRFKIIAPFGYISLYSVLAVFPYDYVKLTFNHIP
jgi:hypothetical protein